MLGVQKHCSGTPEAGHFIRSGPDLPVRAGPPGPARKPAGRPAADREVRPTRAMTETLLSDKNPLLKQVRRAAARGSLTADGFAVAEGFHLARRSAAQPLRDSRRDRCGIGPDHGRRRMSRGLKRTRVVAVSEAVFAALASTETPQGVIALVRPPAVDARPAGARQSAGGGAGRRAGPRQRRSDRARRGSFRRHRRRVPERQRQSLQSQMPARLGRIGVPTACGGLASTKACCSPRWSRSASRCTPLCRARRSSISDADLIGRCAIVIGSEGRGVSATPPARSDRPAHSHLAVWNR